MKTILQSLFLVLLCLPGSSLAAPTRPNILIVLTDDQGMGDFSCHGNPTLKTPNLDRLQAQSVRFADFHVAPMCTPTRGQLMTGQDAVRNGATSVTGGRSFLRPGLPEELGPLRESFVPISIGATAQPVVELTSSDWQDTYADNAGHVRRAAGGPRGGHWNVKVERAGEYEITLRRWPAEEDTTLNGVAAFVSHAPYRLAPGFSAGELWAGQNFRPPVTDRYRNSGHRPIPPNLSEELSAVSPVNFFRLAVEIRSL